MVNVPNYIDNSKCVSSRKGCCKLATMTFLSYSDTTDPNHNFTILYSLCFAGICQLYFGIQNSGTKHKKTEKIDLTYYVVMFTLLIYP